MHSARCTSCSIPSSGLAGYDMVQPSGEGAERCMKQAKKTVNGEIDYINSHGTSTPIGDIKEIEAMKELFKEDMPCFSSTKSTTLNMILDILYSSYILKSELRCLLWPVDVDVG